MPTPVVLPIVCHKCSTRTTAVVRSEGSGEAAQELIFSSGWVPHAIKEADGIRVYFACPKCSNPKPARVKGGPTHPPPPIRKRKES